MEWLAGMYQDWILSIKYSGIREFVESLPEQMPTALDALVFVIFISTMCGFLVIAIDNDEYPRFNEFLDQVL
ncbi:hypothetical protein SMGD1_0683 [Sulfurimonas gotlandica GD1]|uniref:Uncharacterized protein n=1 Tax=Sulfurimonas gotlandica (strain DSM 19862 / JCM 16533 / GD1) TaxID=929558 RepID=H1FW92_SULGG|nr:hypothetical protein [Sulfurimonas gotlandica]EHP29210.1 hypothetical protein SMGD1_0683 [Sulfurimonas gotlandica GD1]